MGKSTERPTSVSQGRKMNGFELERSKNVITRRIRKNRDREKTLAAEYLRGVKDVVEQKASKYSIIHNWDNQSERRLYKMTTIEEIYDDYVDVDHVQDTRNDETRSENMTLLPRQLLPRANYQRWQ